MEAIWALIPAAGRGARMGGTAKQFRKLGDASVVIQTARAFAHHPKISGVIIAAPADYQEGLIEEFNAVNLSASCQVVTGGATRQETVKCLLEAPTLCANDGVLIHDAVRPFLSGALIDRVIAGLQKHGASAPAIEVRDTLRRRGNDGVFEETVSRGNLLRMQTPQCFRQGELLEAHAALSGETFTDDVEVWQRAGGNVGIVQGDTINFKLTTPDDWQKAQALWTWWVNTERSDW